MIEAADAELSDWVVSVLDGFAVTVGCPPKPATGEAPVAWIHLMDLAAAPALRRSSQTPPRLGLRYLIAVAAPTVAATHAALGSLAFAAIERTDMDMEVDWEPLPAAYWAALGAEPRPVLVVRKTVALNRTELAAPRVQQVKTRISVAVPLVGQVLGPRDTPLSGAHVELPTLTQSTRCDQQGKFRFPSVPKEPKGQTLRISAKGQVRSYQVESTGTQTDPVTIHFELGED